MPPRNARKAQIEEALARMTATQVHMLGGAEFTRWWTTSGKTPAFCYCTRKIDQSDLPWVSFVMLPLGGTVMSQLDESFARHRTRKAAKARAWNLYQGWRLARGLKTTWRTFA